MTLKQVTAAFAMLLGLAAPWAASAQPQSFMLTNEHFDVLDTNRDSQISEAEYRNFMLESFGKLDKNGDGVLSVTELSEVLTHEQIRSLDQDNTGMVSQGQFMAQVMADFKRHDYNTDGALQR